MLKASNLSKSFRKKKAVDDVSLQVAPGEIVGLLGPNGAGKTTTFYLLVGWLHPETGAIELNGREITRLPMYLRARRGMIYLPQETSVFRKLTVAENLQAVLEFQALPHADRVSRQEKVLEKLNLAHLSQRIAGTLSGGERRKVEIARSLVLNPAFLLLDEPFSGIDPITIEDIRAIVRQLADDGIGVLITDHNVRETLTITDRAYLIYQSRVLFSGTGRELVENEQARQFYLGQTFQL